MTIQELIKRGEAIVVEKREREQRAKHHERYERYAPMWQVRIRECYPWLAEVVSDPAVKVYGFAENEAAYLITIPRTKHEAYLYLGYHKGMEEWIAKLEGKFVGSLDELAEALYLIQEWIHAHPGWDVPTPFFEPQPGSSEGGLKRFFCFRPEVGEEEACVNITQMTCVRFWADDCATIHVVGDDEDIRVEGAENVRALRAWLAAWNAGGER